jgi:hypothetical protein
MCHPGCKPLPTCLHLHLVAGQVAARVAAWVAAAWVSLLGNLHFLVVERRPLAGSPKDREMFLADAFVAVQTASRSLGEPPKDPEMFLADALVALVPMEMTEVPLDCKS